MAEFEIRTFTEADRAELRQLFSRAAEGSPVESLWGHLESERAMYLEPYMDQEPESLFVAVVEGRLAGHLAGCVDSTRLPSESERMEQVIRRYRLLFRRRTMAFFARAMADMAVAGLRHRPTAGDVDDPRWPAHLHIAVAPAARGTGVADGLMTAWQDRLRALGSPGCYLQTQVENVRAVRFFERMGFTKHGPTPLIPGLRLDGKQVHQQTMVWTP